MEQYYVYVLQNPKKRLGLDETNPYKIEYEPFYVGKGKGDRSEVHYSRVISNNESHNLKLLAEINHLRTLGVTPLVSRIYFNSDESKVYEKEMEVIKYFGLRYKDGYLVNVSTGKAGGWGGPRNPTFDRMESGSHNFLTKNPQLDTPKLNTLRRMLLEVEESSDLSDSKWLTRTGYSNLKSLKLGISRLVTRDNLPYAVIGNKVISTKVKWTKSHRQ